jgi:hypothetical protein
MGSALDTDDLHLPTFGLTFPPLAVALVPNAKIRSPSSRILIAALTLRQSVFISAVKVFRLSFAQDGQPKDLDKPGFHPDAQSKIRARDFPPSQLKPPRNP